LSVVAHLRSGTVVLDDGATTQTSSSSSAVVLPPLHRKDFRWAQAAEVLGQESPEKARVGRIALESFDGCSASSSLSSWWNGSGASQVVVALDDASSSVQHGALTVLENVLGARGAVADFLAGDRYLVVVESSFEDEFRREMAEMGAATAPYAARSKISPEMAALLEVLEVTEVSTAGPSPSGAVDLFQISPTVSLQVMAKGNSAPTNGSAGAPGLLLPLKALDLRLKGQSNETLDFFSAAVDGRDRLLMSVSTPTIPGLDGRGIRRALEAMSGSCGFEVESARDSFESAYEELAQSGRKKHLSFKMAVPRQRVKRVVTALADLPFVNWIEPELEVRVFNHIASTVLQVGSGGRGKREDDPSKRPFWAQGLTGQGEIVGVGDTGLDTKSCFFWDPNHDVGYEHDKVIGYRGFADYEDTSGHGTHVCGSIAGRAGNDSGYSSYNGMAPDAKLAFTDLGLSFGDQRGLIAPETMEEYYEYAYGLGARIHSDSWGGLSTAYTRSAREVDEWHFYHPEFLAMIAAGNDGEFLSSDGVESTVSTPATCKNALAVGATLSMGVMDPPIDPVTNFEIVEPAEYSRRKFQLVSSLFSPVFEFDEDREIELVMTTYPRLCGDLTTQDMEEVKGKVVLVERGDCYFSEKVRRLVDGGALGAIIYNNEESGSGFFKMASSQIGQTMPIPAAAVPMSTGRLLTEAVKSSKGSAKIKFVSVSEKSLPAYESIAEYSSFGPTMDGRVKPDVVAPGEEIKSATSVSSENQCATERISGTSMATPLVSGIVAIVRQYLMGGYYPAGEKGMSEMGVTPSGALIKGVIINGASELKGFAQSGLPLEPSPSFRQGWGRVQLDTSLPLPGSGRSLQFEDWQNLKVTGERHVYCLRTPNLTDSGVGDSRISVTMTWMDAPGALSGGGYLVNDLDLDIASPEGAPGVSWGAAVRPDRINNVEKATIDYPVDNGEYRITVSAHQIKWPMGNGRGQLYSLVAFGPEGFTLSACSADESSDKDVEDSVVEIAASPSPVSAFRGGKAGEEDK